MISLNNRPSIFGGHSLFFMVVLVWTLLLPFFGKAFHIEETVYLQYGQYLVNNPSRPFSCSFIYDNQLIDENSGMTHSPFIGYLNSLLFFFFPQAGEFVFHAFYSLFLIISLLSFHALIRDRLQQPLPGILLFATTPVMMLTSQSIMPDMAAFSFSLLALACIDRYLLSPRRWLLLIGCVFLVVSWFCAYQMVLTSGVLFLTGLFAPSLRKATLLPAIGSLCVLLCWAELTRLQLGHPHFLSALDTSYIVIPDYFENITGMLCNLGGVYLPPLVAAIFLFMYSPWRFRLISIFPVLSVTVMVSTSGNFFSDFIVFPLFFWGGLTLLLSPLWLISRPEGGAFFSRIETARNFFRRQPILVFLFLWWGVFSIFGAFIPSFAAARYYLPLSPLFVIVASLILEKNIATSRKRALWYGLLLIGNLMFSLLLSMADREHAACYPSLFRDPQIQKLSSHHSTIYIVGKFGLQHYGVAAGHRMYVIDKTNLKYGDIVISARYCGASPQNVLTSENYQRLTKLADLSCHGKIPLALTDYKNNAGFHCSLVGILPFTFSREPVEVFSLYFVGNNVGNMEETYRDNEAGFE